MARKNRVSIPDGTYHITSRIVNRQMWFKDPKLKDEIVGWLYGVAAFSGVELLAWCIMDNHFHILVHVPEVPEQYRLDPDDPPASHAFGMRPPECNPALWSPAEGVCPPTVASGEGACPQMAARPDTGFMLSDEEMLVRLGHLYGNPRRIRSLRTMWAEMRAHGNGAAVDAIKERYCRRMYNVSQFVKTLKERIAQAINRRTGHVGHVFEGRFHSGLVERDQSVATTMALYIDFNPHKAGLVRQGGPYAWSSFGQACGAGAHAAECRAAYERLFGCPWPEARELILAAFAARLPEVDNLQELLKSGGIRLTPAQLIHLRVPALTRGAFVGRGLAFGADCAARLAARFPCPSFRSLKWLAQAVDWPRRKSA